MTANLLTIKPILSQSPKHQLSLSELPLQNLKMLFDYTFIALCLAARSLGAPANEASTLQRRSFTMYVHPHKSALLISS